jgi:hypothetical protein
MKSLTGEINLELLSAVTDYCLIFYRLTGQLPKPSSIQKKYKLLNQIKNRIDRGYRYGFKKADQIRLSNSKTVRLNEEYTPQQPPIPIVEESKNLSKQE